ncbi:MAG: glycoside hydrolase family 28 protein [Bacteroidota bacterium]|nr:glycoside hydrolase family 28 protein [Bacteroidota bacterium]
MKRSYLLLGLVMCSICEWSLASDHLITDYGAIADGRTINTRFIQKAIDEVSAAGGGRVVVPAGNFMTGSLFLKSGVDLHIALGAVLLGSHSTDDYQKVDGRAALLLGNNQQHISVSGEGIIDGQGQELLVDIFRKLRSGEAKDNPIWQVKRPEYGRAMVLYFKGCQHVSVTDVTLKNASNWVQDYRECDQVVINRITVQSTAYWNNDGLDITDSKNVRVTHCFINATDDALCLKSENPNSACENIFVDSCVLRSSANGLKFGTANAGGFRNITIRNLTVYDTYRSAIALESVDGGIMENIDIQYVTAKNTGNAIFIRRGHRNTSGPISTAKHIYIAHVKVEVPLYKPDQGYPIEGPPDHLRPGFDQMPVRPSNFHIYGHPFLPYNLVPASIVGIPGYPVQDVTLEDIDISYGGRGSKDIAYIPMESLGRVPENENGYPEFSMFGELPAWGFYIRHAEGIVFKNVRLHYLEDDFRPAIVLDDVKNSEFHELKIPTAREMPMIVLNHTSDITLKNLQLPASEEKAVLKSDFR